MHASFALLSLAALAVDSALAHTYLIKPKSRLSFEKNLGDSTADGTGNWGGLCHMGNGNVCCTSKKMTGSQITTYQRGAIVEAASWRNNHVGGFVRWSIVPVSQSDSQAAFDENVFHQSCNQVGCSATYNGQSPNDWTGGDKAGYKGWSNACSHKFQVPDWLDDGTYTIQWVWFGQGNGNSANSPFQACFEIEISGGSKGPKPTCPSWQGGDLSEKSDVACSFVSVNNPTYQGVCKDANKCSGSYQVGAPKGLAACQAGNAPSTWPLAMESTTKLTNTAFTKQSDTKTPASSNGSTSKSSTGSSSSTKKKNKNKTSGRCSAAYKKHQQRSLLSYSQHNRHKL